MSNKENGTKSAIANSAVSNEIEEVPSSSINKQVNKKGNRRKKTSLDQLELPFISLSKKEKSGKEEWLQGTPSDLRKKISLSNDAGDTHITELGFLVGGMVTSVTRQPNVNRNIKDGLPAMAAALKALKKCRDDRRKAYAKLEELGAKTPTKDRKRQRLYSENIDSGGSTPSQEADVIEQQQQNEKTKSAVKKRLVKSRRPTQQKSEQGGNLTSKR